MTDDERIAELEERVEQQAKTIGRMEARFEKLAEDFTRLRYEINNVEERVDQLQRIQRE